MDLPSKLLAGVALPLGGFQLRDRDPLPPAVRCGAVQHEPNHVDIGFWEHRIVFLKELQVKIVYPKELGDGSEAVG